MHRTALASIVLLVACGGPAQPTQVQVATATASASVTAAPPQPSAPLGIPRGAPLVATFDTSVGVGLLGPVREELEHELGLAEGTLRGNLADLGIDTSRPTTIALAPLDDADEKLVDDISALGAAPNIGDEALQRIVAAKRSTGFRLLVPATDPGKLRATLQKALDGRHWKPVGSGFARGHEVARISADASSVALDLGSGSGAPSATLASLDAELARSEPPPSLGGATLRMTWRPFPLARVSFLSGVSMAAGAVSGESINPPIRARIMTRSVQEASSVFALIGTKSRPTFERIELVAKAAPFEITLRAKPGPSFTMPADATWGPSTTVSLGRTAEVGVSRAFADAWGLPPKPMEAARDGGWLAMLAALPHLLVAAPFEIPRLSHDAAPPEEAARRFERVGASWDEQGKEVWIGVLPAKTSRADALCSLAVSARCAPKDRVTVGKVDKKGHGFAKLVEIDKRWVLLLSKEAADLAVTPKATQESPLHFAASTAIVAAATGAALPLPKNVTGDVSRDGGDVVFRLH